MAYLWILKISVDEEKEPQILSGLDLFVKLFLARRRPVLMDGGQWVTTPLFPPRFWWRASVPDHADHRQDHAENHVKIEALFPEEDESQN